MIARHHRTAHRRLAIAVLSATLPLAAHARLDAAGGTTLEEIIVTAQRTEQSANDVGMDIQAFQGEQIEKLRITSVEGLTAVVPGFTVAQSYQGVPTYTLRGITCKVSPARMPEAAQLENTPPSTGRMPTSSSPDRLYWLRGLLME